MRVSEIRVKQIRVNQGLGVHITKGLGGFGILFQKPFKQFDQEISVFFLLKILKPIFVSQYLWLLRLNTNNDTLVFENQNLVYRILNTLFLDWSRLWFKYYQKYFMLYI